MCLIWRESPNLPLLILYQIRLPFLCIYHLHKSVKDFHFARSAHISCCCTWWPPRIQTWTCTTPKAKKTLKITSKIVLKHPLTKEKFQRYEIKNLTKTITLTSTIKPQEIKRLTFRSSHIVFTAIESKKAKNHISTAKKQKNSYNNFLDKHKRKNIFLLWKNFSMLASCFFFLLV